MMRKTFFNFAALLFLGLSGIGFLEGATFQNPLVSSGADPWIIRSGTNYFYTHTTGGTIFLRRSPTITGLADPTVILNNTVNVFAPPAPNNKNVWAPEVHFLNGKWYLYYAADDGTNANHRLYVAEAITANPQQGFLFKGKISVPSDDKWAIDGTVLQQDDGTLYFVWSGWPGAVDGQQNLYIAPMSNPWTISGPRVMISTPTLPWEGWIQEGPEVLKRNGKIMIVYSANASWTDSYNLGLLTNTNGNLLNPTSWVKFPNPVFRGYADETGGVYGPGHCSFTKSVDGAEDWIIYHAAKFSGAGWNRNVRAQSFSWNVDGSPFLGLPIFTNCPVIAPSGETPAVPFLGDDTNGFVRMEIFTRLPGATLSDLTNAIKFPNNPDLVRYVSQLETPVNLGENYGVKLSGYLRPTLTTNYIFYISANGPGQLFLSTNDSPLFKRPIALEPQWNNSRDWNGIARRVAWENISRPIFLQAGQRYYFDAIMKAGVGADNLAVTWKISGTATPTNGAPPIAKDFLQTFSWTTAPIFITQQPTNRTIYQGSSAIFSVGTLNPPLLQYQWQRQTSGIWQNISGAVSQNLMFTNAIASENSYRVLVSNSVFFTNSSPATLRVLEWPKLGGRVSADGKFLVTFPTDPAFKYFIYTSTNLLNWENVSIITNANGAVEFFDDTSSSRQKFYKVLVEP
ncbi:MAG: family 43 glycosylhydrolase [Verrucomicrobiota bacterium]|nr:family 43 glycosylhydrolase [Verrucomicrobiota bacterium]